MDREWEEVKKRKVEVPSTNKDSGSTELGNTFQSMTHQDDVDATGSAPIYNLNDDCLREIFSYLSERRLIKIERVCKKWKEIAQSVWVRQKSLDYVKIMLIIKNTEILNIVCFESILKRCGKYLKTLDLFSRELFCAEKSFGDAIVDVICKYCKNLKHLRIPGGLISVEGFKKLESAIAPNLESFKINRCHAVTDEILETFLKNAPKLDNLCVNGNSKLSGNSLFQSGKAFKELRIEYCDEINADVLIKVLDNSYKLEVLKCPGICTFNTLSDRPIREHLVEFHSYSSSFFKDEFKSFLPFPNLRCLRLNGDSSVSNQVLAQFHKWFPNLEILDLSGRSCKEKNWKISLLSNDGIKNLVKLPKLKSLNLSHLKFLSGSTLVYLAINMNGKIEEMDCAGCQYLCNSDIIEFASFCPKLKFLNISGCKNLTDECLTGVINALKSIKNSEESFFRTISFSKNCKITNYLLRI